MDSQDVKRCLIDPQGEILTRLDIKIENNYKGERNIGKKREAASQTGLSQNNSFSQGGHSQNNF
ncbi:hypothetical protein M153_8350001086 [Pseudoloma neurophilia]|uniref:Uncharacterized protein n=1 Tax=Pseudoloma neurophilia TaxID=146866 RepID=A0A0R0M1I7_9MICR|nr:hypothetical protein M153_8350001086 [Pseudoloma neurophilia]